MSADPSTAPLPLGRRLSATAARHPDRLAVVAGGDHETFAGLDARVDVLAARIGAAVAPGTRVAVLVDRGVDSVVAPYAIWRAGAVYLPLDPAWPVQRIDDVLCAAGVGAVVASDAGGLTVVARPAVPPPGAAVDDVAYVIHTSGSSGAPKGVQITHAAAASLVDNHQQLLYGPLGLLEGPVGMIASTTFDSSIERMALVALGYTLHVLDDAVRLSPDRLIDHLQRHGIVNVDVVPSHLRVLVRAGLLDRATALRLLIVGGEPVDPELWETLAGAPGVAAFNVYGPTENTVNTSVARILPGREPNIGRPLPGVRCTVVDDEARAVPAGEVGELVVSGRQLSVGYLGAAALTGRAFRSLDGERAYWTGDLARVVDREGTMEILGRVDDQVKINGVRIEPEEVRSHLRALSGVEDAAVTPVDGPLGRRLLATIVPTGPEQEADLDGMRTALAATVPATMVPTQWMQLPELPMTASLKIDHPALRDLWRAGAETARSDITEVAVPDPVDAVEGMVQVAFSAVLGNAAVDPSAHFFAVGGDSVAAMRLIVELRTRTGVELDLVDLIKNPTVQALAALVAARAEGR